MSMPEITFGTGTRAQSVTDMIESVALEQTALSHILNAEGEKIQHFLTSAASNEDLVSVNKAAQSMVNAVARLEMILQEKLELFADCVCSSPPETEPPAPPIP